MRRSCRGGFCHALFSSDVGAAGCSCVISLRPLGPVGTGAVCTSVPRSWRRQGSRLAISGVRGSRAGLARERSRSAADEHQRRSAVPYSYEGDTHYFVKLEDSASSKSILTVFVRAGRQVDIQVPLGTYVVKYASGRRWYGYQHLFGPESSYNRADTTFAFRREGNQMKGFSITLYAVPGGNLKTSPIKASDF